MWNSPAGRRRPAGERKAVVSTKTLSLIATALALLLLAIGAAGALAGRPERAPAAAAVVSGGISYQGRLTSPSGAPLSGNYTMRFVIYTASGAGTALWDSGNLVVAVDRGLFQVKLGVDPSDFNGQSLWLSIIVNGQTLSPRQEILPAPYALGLRPGVDVVGDAIGAADATFAGYAPATGTALYADANGGVGLFGDSENSYGVWGSSDNSWGGYFTSASGYGIRVTTNGTDHYDHGAYISSNGGYAVLAQSANNMAVRGEAGNVVGISVPFGRVGVVGLGEARGIHAASDSGIGIYGTSGTNYAGYFYSNGYRGILASSASGFYAGYFTNRGGSTQPGVFIGGTLTVSGAKSGYVVDIGLNEGPDLLEAGDVVSVVGVSDPVVGEIPVMRVVRATDASAAAVAGVVDQRFVVEVADGEKIPRPDGEIPLRAANNAIQPGEYVSIVTLGAFKMIKVDAGYGPIEPGDLLTPSPNPGYAMRAEAGSAGKIIGKALEAVSAGRQTIAVYVTIQ